MSAMPVSASGSRSLPVTSRQVQSRQGANPATISRLITPLFQWSLDDISLSSTALLLEVSASSLIERIRGERWSRLPFEASSYDNLLAWAQALVERLNAVEEIVEPFMADIYLATSLAYGYFAMLLEYGEDNATPLGLAFGFFHDISAPLENILRGTSLDSTEKIAEQLALALVDLVTLIARFSVGLCHAMRGSGDELHSNFHKHYAGQIETFRSRCEKVTIAISRHRLLGATRDPDKGDNIDAIRSWLAPDDRVIARLDENVSVHAMEREENTCSWISLYVERWRTDQSAQIHIFGRSGTGKSVLSQAILEYLQWKRAASTSPCLCVFSSIRFPAEGTMRSIARSLLHQMFIQSIGHVPLLLLLSDAFDRSRRTTDSDDYDSLLWDTLKRALTCLAPGNDQVFLVVDGVDEALCDETTLLRKLLSITAETANVKLITLGTQKPPTASGQTLLEVRENLVFDDISTVVESSLVSGNILPKLPGKDKEAIIGALTAASEGSFLWVKLACRHIHDQVSPDQLSKAMDLLCTTKPSVSDMIHLRCNMEDVSLDAKHMLALLAVAQRPLSPAEVQTLASILVDQQTIPVSDRKDETFVLRKLRPLNRLIFLSNDVLSFRHALIKDAVLKLVTAGHVHPNEDPAIDVLTRLFICLKCSIGESSEPALTPLDQDTATSLQHSQALIPYALRYWPIHYQNLFAATQSPITRLAERFAPYLPVSTTCIRLQSMVWPGLPPRECLRYHELTAVLYRTALGPNHVATLQCTILLAGLYDRLKHVDPASRLYYDAALRSRTSLTARHPLTLQLTSRFLDLTSGQKITGAQSSSCVGEENAWRSLSNATSFSMERHRTRRVRRGDF